MRSTGEGGGLMSAEAGSGLRKAAVAAGAALLAGGVIFYIWCALKAGGSVEELARFFAAVLLLGLIPGYVITERMLKGLEGAGVLPVSLLMGYGLLVCGYILFGLLGDYTLCCAPALLLDGVFAVRLVSGGGSGKLKRAFIKTNPLVYGIIGVVLAAYSLAAVLRNPTTEAAGRMVYHSDMLFYLGNSSAVTFGYPLADLRFAGSFLRYHIFNDAAIGLLAVFSKTEMFTAWNFYFTPYSIFAAVCGFYASAKMMFKKSYIALFAALAALLFSRDYAAGFYALIVNTNSMMTAFFALSAFLVVFCLADELDFKITWRHAALLAVCAALLTMAKNIMGALAICAMAVSALYLIITKRSRPALNYAVAASAALFAAVWLGLFTGAANYLEFVGFSLLPSFFKEMITLFPVASALYLANLALCAVNFKKLKASTVFANAVFLGGMLAYKIFDHWGTAHVYFAVMATPFLWICALNVVSALSDKKPRLAALALAGTLALCAVPAYKLCAQYAKDGINNARLIDGGLVMAYTDGSVDEADTEAMRWIRANTDKYAIFATNRHDRNRLDAEGCFHYYSAISERRFYVEGWRFAIDYGADYHEMRRRLEVVSDGIFLNAATKEEAFALARSEGIDYLVVSKGVGLPPWSAEPVFDNESVTIYEVG